MKPLLRILLSVPLLTMACQRGTLMHSFQPVADASWGIRDTLVFTADSGQWAGTGELHLCLRLRHDCRQRTLWAVVEQREGNGSRRDTVEMTLADESGRFTGKGVNCMQYQFPVRNVEVHPTESLSFRVYHIMRLPVEGVQDVGLRLTLSSN